MSWTSPAERAETRKILLAAVEAVRGALLDGADEAESLARLPHSTADALNQSGLLAMKLPKALGGVEADPVTIFEVIEAVTRIDPSAGWCTLNWIDVVGLLAAFLPDEAAEHIFAEGALPTAAGVLMPTGRAAPVDGGYLVNGRWSYASGIHHAQWLVCGAMIGRNGQGPPDVRMLAIPASEAQIHDNWQVAGLKGTGSCDFSVADVFVPEAYVFDWLGGQPRRGGPLYRMGVPGYFAFEHAAFALGVGRLALDTILEQAPSKKRGYKPSPLLAERPTFQRAMGECDLRLRAARGLVVEILEEAWEAVCAKGVIEPRLQAEMRSSAVFATEASTEVVSVAFRYGGASALFLSNILQRCFRDVNAAAQHLIVSETAYEVHGQFALGFSDADPLG